MSTLNDGSKLHDAAAGALRGGDLATAEGLCRRILDTDPNRIETLEMLAELLLRSARTAEAMTFLRRAVELPAVAARTFALLSAVLRVAGQLSQARTAVERGLRRYPDFSPLLLEVALIAEAQGNPQAAIEAYTRVLQTDPNSVTTWLNLGVVLGSLRRFSEAVPVYKQALELAPDLLAAHIRLGNALGELQRFDEAIACYQRALAIAPDNAPLRSELAGCLLLLGRVPDSISILRQTLQRAPHAIAAHSLLLFALNLCTSSQEELTREHERINVTLRAAAVGRAMTAAAPVPKAPDGRIRVGFVSADLRRHSVSYFLEPLIERIDRGRFRITCYATGGTADEVTARLRSQPGVWVECHGWSDEALEARIRGDGLDVLIDLSGHAMGGRPSVLARRPATVQIAFLGYPTTTGLTGMDFRVSDRLVDPLDRVSGGSERILRMPHSYFCYRPPSDAPQVSDLPLLRRGAPTFGCFNALAKITESTLSAWAAVLQALATARLVLKAQGLAGPEARSRLLARCAAAGIDPKRVEVLEWCPDPQSHLECYAQVDVALDTFPYSGATTTCEALWMGVPVVSLAGDTHASRMSLSILSAAQRAAWVVTDTPGLVATCVALVSNPERLAGERASLRATLRTSALMDETGYVSAFERLLEDAVAGRGSS